MAEIPEWEQGGDLIEIDVGGPDPSTIRVGHAGVTRIEKTYKSGLHSNIPYVRVWKGDQVSSEHCQHALAGVYFQVAP